MSHTYAAIMTSVWSDKDFLSLTVEAQRLYFFLLSQPSLSKVGYTDINLKKWANKAINLEKHDLEKQLAELEIARFIVVDYDTDELLIRTYVRNSGVWKQPLIVASMAPAVVEIESGKLRRALLHELDRLPLGELKNDPSPKGGPSVRTQVTLRVQQVREELLRGMTCDVSEYEMEAKPSREGIGDPLGTGTGSSFTHVHTGLSSSFSSEPPLRDAPDAPSVTIIVGVLDDEQQDTAKIAEPVREDVERLCQRLAEKVVENGNREPTITKKWRDAARLLLDNDRTGPNKERITFEKAMRLLEWSQQDDFWAGNIHSMPTFRKQYDKLRAQALREWNEQHRPAQNALNKAEQRSAHNRSLVAYFAEREYGAAAQQEDPWGRFAQRAAIAGEVVRREIA
jgi:hypothetical protein